MTRLIVALSNSANALKKLRVVNIYLLKESKATFLLIATL
jgi:hypothetical protein